MVILRISLVLVALAVIALYAGCEDAEVAAPRDYSAGPLVGTLVGEPLPWCEELPTRTAYEPGVDCQYKYLKQGISTWMAMTTVAFVADVEPNCADGVERFCAGDNSDDCMEICPFTFHSIGPVVFGDPSTVDLLAGFEPEFVEIDGKSQLAYHLDGSYPEASLWTISPGLNLIFANKACYSERYTGDDALYFVAGIYPVNGDVVYDVDDVTITVSDLVSAADSSGIIIDEAARYAARCGFSL